MKYSIFWNVFPNFLTFLLSFPKIKVNSLKNVEKQSISSIKFFVVKWTFLKTLKRSPDSEWEIYEDYLWKFTTAIIFLYENNVFEQGLFHFRSLKQKRREMLILLFGRPEGGSLPCRADLRCAHLFVEKELKTFEKTVQLLKVENFTSTIFRCQW